VAGKLSKSTSEVSVSVPFFAGLGWKYLKGRCYSEGFESKVVQLRVIKLWDWAGAHPGAPREPGEAKGVPESRNQPHWQGQRGLH